MSFILWFAFIYFSAPAFALADATFEIPYALDADGAVECTLELGAYNGSGNFYAYTIAKDTRENVLVSGSTSGKGMCQGEFKASTASGGDLFSGAGDYFLSLYLDDRYREMYGYMVFDCPVDGVCAHKKITTEVTQHGNLTGAVVWTADKNPYLVDRLVLSPGATLEIKPGVVVKFRNKISFIYVEAGARLEISGTESEKVYFTSIKDDELLGDTNADGVIYPPSAGDWDNVINYGEINATGLISRYATIGIINQAGGVINLDQSTIRDTRNYGILQQDGKTKITNSKIINNQTGIYNLAGQTDIFNSSIYNNSTIGAREIAGDLKAQHNFWGHETGPFLLYSNEPSGQGQSLGDGIPFIPWLTAEPAENKYLGCLEDCFSNVLFLPGMMASRLYEADQEVWFSIFSNKQVKMALNDEGKSVYSVYTKDDTRHTEGEGETGVIDQVEFAGGGLSSKIYKSFLHDLWAWESLENLFEDHAFIPYDWRLSLEDIINNGEVLEGKLSYADTTAGGRYIINKLKELAANSRNGKVTIVAHSNGGLVAKQLIHQLQKEDNPLVEKIDKLILIATPQIGTPEAMATILHGVRVSDGFVMDADMSRFLAEDFPVIYNLLPSGAYFTTVNTDQSPLITFEDVESYATQISAYGTSVSTADEMQGYLLGAEGRTKPATDDIKNPNIGNSFLYDQAKAAHDTLDNWQPPTGLKIIQVAGWGEETKSYIEYVERKALNGVMRKSIKVKTTIDGDHTVVEPSALWMSPNVNSNVERWWVDLDLYNENTSPDREHKDVLEVLNLREFIKTKINKTNFADKENIVVPTRPFSEKIKDRLHFTLHSPLALGIKDEAGNYTGLDLMTGEVSHEIPDVYYEQIGDVQFISAPYGSAYTLLLDGFAQGSFALDIDMQSGNNITASTIFEGIPASMDTKAFLTIDDNFQISDAVLEIDHEDDGVIDVSLNATLNGRTQYPDIPDKIPVTTYTPAQVIKGYIPSWILEKAKGLIKYR